MILVIIVALVWFVGLMLALSLCRVAAESDEQIRREMEREGG